MDYSNRNLLSSALRALEEDEHQDELASFLWKRALSLEWFTTIPQGVTVLPSHSVMASIIKSGKAELASSLVTFLGDQHESLLLQAANNSRKAVVVASLKNKHSSSEVLLAGFANSLDWEGDYETCDIITSRKNFSIETLLSLTGVILSKESTYVRETYLRKSWTTFFSRVIRNKEEVEKAQVYIADVLSFLPKGGQAELLTTYMWSSLVSQQRVNAGYRAVEDGCKVERNAAYFLSLQDLTDLGVTAKSAFRWSGNDHLKGMTTLKGTGILHYVDLVTAVDAENFLNFYKGTKWIDETASENYLTDIRRRTKVSSEAADVLATSDSPNGWVASLICETKDDARADLVLRKFHKHLTALWASDTVIKDSVTESEIKEIQASREAMDQMVTTLSSLKGDMQMTPELLKLLAELNGPLDDPFTDGWNSTSAFCDHVSLTSDEILDILVASQHCSIMYTLPHLLNAENLDVFDKVCDSEELGRIHLANSAWRFNPSSRINWWRSAPVFNMPDGTFVIPSIYDNDFLQKCIEEGTETDETSHHRRHSFRRASTTPAILVVADLVNNSSKALGLISSKYDCVEAFDLLGSSPFENFNSALIQSSADFAFKRLFVEVGTSPELWEQALCLIPDYPGNLSSLIKLLRREAKLRGLPCPSKKKKEETLHGCRTGRAARVRSWPP